MKRLTPIKAIRKWCLECVGYSSKEVLECTGNERDTPCPLYPYRLGKNPSIKAKYFPKDISQGLKDYHNKKKTATTLNKTSRTQDYPKEV